MHAEEPKHIRADDQDTVQTGARVDKFVYIRVEDRLLDEDPPQIHIIREVAERLAPTSH